MGSACGAWAERMHSRQREVWGLTAEHSDERRWCSSSSPARLIWVLQAAACPLGMRQRHATVSTVGEGAAGGLGGRSYVGCARCGCGIRVFRVWLVCTMLNQHGSAGFRWIWEATMQSQEARRSTTDRVSPVQRPLAQAWTVTRGMGPAVRMGGPFAPACAAGPGC